MLRKAQRYTVNVYPGDWENLQKEDAVCEIQGGGIFYLKDEYYSEDFGIAYTVVATMRSGVC